jgi:Tol biopolymer transport system component
MKTRFSKRCRSICCIRATLAVLLILSAASCDPNKQGLGKKRDPHLFGIYTATLDGKDVKLIISDPSQQMTHARVSPDKKRITFTRYNKKGLNGLAEVKNGPAFTEIMVVNMDGTGLQTIVPPKRGVIASNSSWTPDGKGLTYLSTDNPQKRTQIKQIDLATRKITTIKTPDNLKPSDPYRVGSKIVFPTKGDGLDSLWIMNIDGTGAKQLTHPKIPKPKKRRIFPLGDYDPKLSPDGSKVAVMRYFGGETWRMFVVDVATGQEKELSANEVTEGLPEWSSDGKLLMFWHADRKQPRKMGIYTMKPDGSNRKMIPLPRGYLHNHASFFPGEGSSSSARIIYVAKKNPLLP